MNFRNAFVPAAIQIRALLSSFPLQVGAFFVF